MSMVRSIAFLAVVLTAPCSLAADLGGTWSVNVEKSRWGTRPKPESVTLWIRHTEPALTEHGVVTYPGKEVRSFEFAGAIDGRPYPMQRSFRDGTAKLRWIRPLTLETIFHTPDGNTIETTETTISKDGRTLTRNVRLTRAGTTSTSTEVYDRQFGTT